MDELPDVVVKYIRDMSLRGCESAEKLCELFEIGIFLNVTFTQEQAEKLAHKLNEYLKDMYKIDMHEGFTISRLVDFLPESFDEDMSLYGYSMIYLDKDATNDGKQHVIDVWLSEVSSEWMQS